MQVFSSANIGRFDPSAKIDSGLSRSSSVQVSPQSIAQDLKSNQRERWFRFHESEPRIILVDDNPRTTARLYNGLEDLYGDNIHICNDPEEALTRIRSAADHGRPFDLVLSDLHMPNMMGTEFLKALGLACPAVVINTASMMSPVLADLCLQMNTYSAANVSKMINDHQENRRPASVPLAPVFINLKDQGWLPLVDKIDSALLLKEEMPAFCSAIHSFLKVFEPKLVPLNFSSVAVHHLVEELRNSVEAIRPVTEALKAKEEVINTNWWSHNGPSLEASLQHLSNAHFSNLCMENPQLTWSKVHALMGEFLNLSPEGLSQELSLQSESSYLLEAWQSTYEQFNIVIRNISEGLRAYALDQIDLFALSEVEASNAKVRIVEIESGDTSQHKRVLIDDPDKLLSSFLRRAFQALSAIQSIESDGFDSSTFVSIKHIREINRLSERRQITQALSLINAGDYYEVNFVASSGQNLNKTFAELVPDLSLLRSKQILNFIYDKTNNRFCLLVKASENNLALMDYKQDLIEASQSPSEIIENLCSQSQVKIYKKQILDLSIYAIGALPQELDFKVSSSKMDHAEGIVYRHGAEVFFSYHSSHKEASRLISAYIGQRQVEISQITNMPSAEDVYREGVRVSFQISRGCQIEPETDIDKSKKAQQALVSLGLLEARTEISARCFIAAKALASKVLEEIQITPNRPSWFESYFEYDQIISQLKDLHSSNMKPSLLETLDSYQAIATGEKLEEPSFIIRTRQALKMGQIQKILYALKDFMPALDLSAWGVTEFDQRIYIEGDSPRKSGLFLFMPQQVQEKEKFSSCAFSHKLVPLIEGSSSSRLGREGIIYADANFLPEGSLIFGGGDHSLTMCKSQWGMALVLESLLQEGGIAYDVCRGQINEASRYYRFDGKNLIQGFDQQDGVFVDYID